MRAAACLKQLGISLFLWSTTRWEPWGTWQHRSSPLGKTRPGPRDSVEAHLGREARSGAEEHMAAPEFNSARRQGPRPCDTWQHRSSPQQGGKVRDRVTHDGSRVHLCREMWSEATVYMTACGCTSCSLSLLRTYMRRYLVFRVSTDSTRIMIN
jgi:hypothetical protein